MLVDSAGKMLTLKLTERNGRGKLIIFNFEEILISLKYVVTLSSPDIV